MEKKLLEWHKMYIGGIHAQDDAHSYEVHPYRDVFWLFSYVQDDRSKVGSRVLSRQPMNCLTVKEAAHLAQCYANEINGVKPPALTFDELCDCM